MTASPEPDDARHGDGPVDGDEAQSQTQPEARAEARSETFEELVDGWRREGPVPEWPSRLQPGLAEEDAPPPAPEDDRIVAPREPEDDRPVVPREPEEDHFVPPEPPPIPRLAPPAAVGLALLTLGLVLLIAPRLIGVPETFGIPLGLLALASGIGWLVLRLWPSPPPQGDGDGEDDGAVL